MASDKGYLEYVLEQLAEAEDISYRPMMGEYVLYCQGKVFGGIYDDRFLVKNIASARAFLPDAPLELPYVGGKEMLLIENMDDRDFLRRLTSAMADELPAPKKRKKSNA